MEKYEQLKELPEKQFRRLIGLQRDTFEKMVAILLDAQQKSDRYRNRRKRFGLRFNLVAGIHNYERRGGETGRHREDYRLFTTLSHPSMRRPCPKLITNPNLRSRAGII